MAEQKPPPITKDREAAADTAARYLDRWEKHLSLAATGALAAPDKASSAKG